MGEQVSPEGISSGEQDTAMREAAIGAILDAQQAVAEGQSFGRDGVLTLPTHIVRPNDPEAAGKFQRNADIYSGVATDSDGRLAVAGLAPEMLGTGVVENVHPDGSGSRGIYTALGNQLVLVETTHFAPGGENFGYVPQVMPRGAAETQMVGDIIGRDQV